MRKSRIALAAFFTVAAVAYAATNGAAESPASSDTVPTSTTAPAFPPCTDLGDGEVWWDWNVGVPPCDVVPPQTLNYHNVPDTPEAAEDCAWYGGIFDGDFGVCLDVDY